MWEDQHVVITSSSERRSGTQPTCDYGETPSWPGRRCLLLFQPPHHSAPPIIHLPSAPCPSEGFLLPNEVCRGALYTLESSTCPSFRSLLKHPLLMIPSLTPRTTSNPREHVFTVPALHLSGWQFYVGSHYDLSNVNVSLAGKQFKLMIRFLAHTTVPGRVELLSF